MPNQWKHKTPEQRFWEKVNKSPGLGPRGDCWLWTGGKRGNRKSSLSDTYYGGVNWFGRVMLAHRVSFIIANGREPKTSVLHVCDTPACVNPEHLSEGSQTDNVRDAWNKGRGWCPGHSTHRRATGERHGNSKLTWLEVREIRSLYPYNSGPLLARKFGVTSPCIYSVIKGRTWKVQ